MGKLCIALSVVIPVCSVVIFVTFMSLSFKTINNDEMGLMYDVQTKILNNEAYQQGRYSSGPTKKFFLFPNTFVGVELPVVKCLSQDGLPIAVVVNFQYKIQVINLAKLFRLFGNGYDAVVRLIAQSSVQEACGNYPASGFYFTREAVQDNIFSILQSKTNNTYIDVEFLQLNNVSLDSTFQQAIQSTLTAQQDVQQALNERLQLLIQAQTSVLSSKQNLSAALITAQANADASVILASGQAQAITLQYQAQLSAYSEIQSTLGLGPKDLINYIAVQTLQSSKATIGIESPAQFSFFNSSN